METAVSVVLNAAGNFVAMAVPLLVKPDKLRNAGAGPLVILGKPGRSMCGSSALSAELLCQSSLRLVDFPIYTGHISISISAQNGYIMVVYKKQDPYVALQHN